MKRRTGTGRTENHIVALRVQIPKYLKEKNQNKIGERVQMLKNSLGERD